MSTEELVEELRGFAEGSTSARASLMRDAADALERLEGERASAVESRLAQTWRDGYFTGKRDYAGSITGGRPIRTPNPYGEGSGS